MQATPAALSAQSKTSRKAILDAFEIFRVAIDDANDRRERLVKISRDITIHSKRVIFLLHRLVTTPAAEGPEERTTPPSKEEIRATEIAAAKEAFVKLNEIKVFFNAIANELEGQETDRYNQAM